MDTNWELLWIDFYGLVFTTFLQSPGQVSSSWIQRVDDAIPKWMESHTPLENAYITMENHHFLAG